MNRRDLLKLFGVGATIVPVVGGMSQELTRAIIIEPPKVEVAPEPTIIAAGYDAFMNREICEITVFLRQKNPDKRYRLDCSGFIARYDFIAPVDVTEYGDWRRTLVRPLPEMEMTIRVTGASQLVTSE